MRVYQVGAVRLNRGWIRYYLLQSGRIRREYGICVTAGSEAALIPAIMDSEREIRRLLRCMVRGRVTPVTARDIVEDWLCGR